MNTYFEQNNQFNSNKRIIEAYFSVSERKAGTLQKMLDSLLSVLAAILSTLTCERAISLYKVSGAVLSLVGMVGIVGAAETGKIGLFAALLLGACVVGLEYLCIRPRRQRD